MQKYTGGQCETRKDCLGDDCLFEHDWSGVAWNFDSSGTD